MSENYNRFPSFLRLSLVHKREIIRSWDIAMAFLLAFGLAFFIPRSFFQGNLNALAAAELGVASALVGIILAGLAILAVFLDREYVEILAKTGGGLEEDLFMFWFTAALAVWSIVANVILLLFADRLVNSGIPIIIHMVHAVLPNFHPSSIFPYPSFNHFYARVGIALSTWLFLWALFAALNLISFIAGHTSNRAAQIALENSSSSSSRKESQPSP